jgi:hypothetical protein
VRAVVLVVGVWIAASLGLGVLWAAIAMAWRKGGKR